MNELVATLYTPQVTDARTRFQSGPGGQLLSDDFDPTLFQLFLLNYCARGVRMTEPVESWISRAGQRCRQVGLEKLGISLEKHAVQEAGHHLMMIADTHALVRRWNASQTKQLSADELLAVSPSPAVGAYAELHENVIRGDAPYCQIAIEFEIERLSVTWGPPLMRRCAAVLGEGNQHDLTFLVEHVEIDQGHTKFNELQLERLLTEHPGFAPELARAGASALDIYGAFLGDCLGFARAMRAGMSGKVQAESGGQPMVQA